MLINFFSSGGNRTRDEWLPRDGDGGGDGAGRGGKCTHGV